MSRLSSLFINPVLNKEVKLRFRSFKNFLGIFLYLAVCGAICLGFIYVEANLSYNSFTAEDSRNLFMILSVGQLVLIVFMTPGLTAGAISGEREKQTLNILLTTQQSSTSIIISKLFSSIGFLILMMIASLPLYSLVFLYGGVSPEMVFITFGLQLLTMFTIGSFGVMFSTIIRKTIVATITTYGITLFMLVGTLLLFFLIIRLSYAQNVGSVSPTDNYFPYLVLMLNPVVVMISSFEPSMFAYEFQNMGIDWPLWTGFIFSYLGLAVLALILGINRLRPSMRTKRQKRIEA